PPARRCSPLATCCRSPTSPGRSFGERRRRRIPGALPALNGRPIRRRRSTTSTPRRTSRLARMTTALERRDAVLLGMWAFLATEVLFFGPLFFGYVHGRAYQPEAFAAASHHMHIVLGTLNTALLLTSSLTMALGVRAARSERSPRLWLALTALLGVAFLGIKAYEYTSEWSEAASATG